MIASTGQVYQKIAARESEPSKRQERLEQVPIHATSISSLYITTPGFNRLYCSLPSRALSLGTHEIVSITPSPLSRMSLSHVNLCPRFVSSVVFRRMLRRSARLKSAPRYPHAALLSPPPLRLSACYPGTLSPVRSNLTNKLRSHLSRHARFLFFSL